VDPESKLKWNYIISVKRGHSYENVGPKLDYCS